MEVWGILCLIPVLPLCFTSHLGKGSIEDQNSPPPPLGVLSLYCRGQHHPLKF